jgi:hypothetical protein
MFLRDKSVAVYCLKKTDLHDITEILSKVALNTLPNQTNLKKKKKKKKDHKSYGSSAK